MIAAEHPAIRYLTRSDVAALHKVLMEVFSREHDEHMPALTTMDQGALDALLLLPAQSFDGLPSYPSLPEKAAILFYSVTKRHLFFNGNKRMAVACLVFFIFENGYRLAVTADELTEKTLEVAMSDPLTFPAIKRSLTHWISQNLLPLNDNDPSLLDVA
jgi:death on curing protein